MISTAVLAAALLALQLQAQQLQAQQQPDDLLGELERTVREIRETHPDPFARISEGDFSRATDAVRSDLESLSQEQFVARMMALVAMIQDGHTRYDSENGSFGFDSLLPVVAYRFADGFHVVASTARHSDLVGARLTSLDGVPIDELAGRLEPYSSGDNDSGRQRDLPHALQRTGLLRALGVIDSSGSVQLQVETEAGDVWTSEVEPVPYDCDCFAEDSMSFLGAAGESWSGMGAPMRLHWLKHGQPPPVAWAELDQIRALHLKLRRVRDGDRAFADEITDALGEFDERGLDRLIVDIRGNPGGNNMLLRPLIHGIIRRGLDRDRLFVVTDRNTFSAAVNLATRLDRELDPVFVGEPPAGAPNHFGDAEVFYHYQTDLTAIVSTLRWQDAEPWDERDAIEPQLPVVPEMADFRDGRDPAISAIRTYISRGAARPDTRPIQATPETAVGSRPPFRS